MLKELSQELVDIGVPADANAEARARARRDELHAALSTNRSRRNQLEKQLTFCEAEMDSLQKKLRKLGVIIIRFASRWSMLKRAGVP